MVDDAVKVKVVYTEGCANTLPTIQRIESMAMELGVAIELTRVLIHTQPEAEAHRFLGSPTVQINGLDLDPVIRDKQSFGFT
jgi:hypothetical protein